MPTARAFLLRNRFALAAIAISAAVHAAVLVGMPPRIAAIEDKKAAIYSATLDPAAALAPPARAEPAPPAPAPRPRRAPRPKPEALTGAQVALPAMALADSVLTPLDGPTRTDAAPEEKPVMLAAAEPLAPMPRLEPAFPAQAFPANVSISYHLSSSFAEGNAVYSWQREGASYRITGEAEAEGFFALFLEGRIEQESRGTVTDLGLRPESFTERRPNNVREGLEFDWKDRKVTLFRGDKSNTSALADNTVDWLSMIFQLAHVPPRGESMPLQVFTQRKMYRYQLQVLGVEEIEIPLGRVRGLHLRHIDEKDRTEVVDVWLGVEQHYLPVKLRFPVARNRLMVEQVATRVSAQ